MLRPNLDRNRFIELQEIAIEILPRLSDGGRFSIARIFCHSSPGASILSISPPAALAMNGMASMDYVIGWWRRLNWQEGSGVLLSSPHRLSFLADRPVTAVAAFCASQG